MQARAIAVGQCKIVHIALAMQPGRGHAAVRPVLFRIFGEAKAEPGVEVDGVLYLGREYVEMIDALRVAAAVKIVAAQQMRALLHGRIELDPETEGVGKLQGTALERWLGESVSDAV